MASDAENIQRSVQEAFKADVGDDFVLQFLAELRTNLRDAERSTRRATALILVLAAVFELVNRQGVAEASFFFIKVRSFDLILVGIPVVIAYLCYEISAYVVESNNYYWVQRKIMDVRYPSVSAQDIDLFAIPVGDPFGQALRDVRFRRRNRILTVAAWLRFPILVVIPGLAAYIFEVYAIIQLLAQSGLNIAFVWAAILVTLGLLALAAVRFATEAPHGGGPWGVRSPQPQISQPSSTPRRK